MNKICKILGAIATVGATAVAGTLLYRKGYDKGFDKALRKNDDDYDFDDFYDDDDYEEEVTNDGMRTVYCDNDSKELGFTFPQFIQSVEILSEPDNGLEELYREMNVDFNTAYKLYSYIKTHHYHCGGNA